MIASRGNPKSDKTIIADQRKDTHSTVALLMMMTTTTTTMGPGKNYLHRNAITILTNINTNTKQFNVAAFPHMF